MTIETHPATETEATLFNQFQLWRVRPVEKGCDTPRPITLMCYNCQGLFTVDLSPYSNYIQLLDGALVCCDNCEIER